MPKIMKIFIRTFGCAHNQADSEAMAGLLEAAMHIIVENKEESDLIIINSCTVKDPSQKRFIHEVQTAGKPVILAGCVPQGDPSNKDLQDISAVGVKQIHKIVEVVERTYNGEIIRLLNPGKNPPLLMPVRRKNPLIEIIPVNSGCLGKCTYCKTKHARGHLLSYRPEEIIEKARIGLEAGVKEIWLTSEDLGAYGIDIGTNISSIAKKILDLPYKFKLRLGMANPPYMKNQIKELISVLNHPKCYKFIHIPVQSGSNTVLERMQREYNIEEFCSLVDALIAGIPGISIATDIIVGFPGETDNEFLETMDLIKKYNFPVVNISKFYARPGTPAARMKPVDTKIVKARSELLTRYCEKLNPNITLEGTTEEILFTDRGKDNTLIGHTSNYREVIIPKGVIKAGEFVNIKLEKAHRYYLEGTTNTNNS